MPSGLSCGFGSLCREIGRELLEQIGRPVDVFCGSVGTAGMVMGVDDVLNGATRQTGPLQPGGGHLRLSRGGGDQADGGEVVGAAVVAGSPGAVATQTVGCGVGT